MGAKDGKCTMATPTDIPDHEVAEEPRKLVTARDILDAEDISIELFDVPEWNGSVYLRTLKSGEGDEIARLMSKNTPNANARVAIKCICDQNGGLVFKPRDAEDLANKSFSAINRILEKIVDMNNMGESADRELEGN